MDVVPDREVGSSFFQVPIAMHAPPPLPLSGLQPGTLIDSGRYRLQRVLGAGGNGIVWLATHAALNAEVVIKFPRFAEASSAADLRKELQYLVAFSNRHPHIANILDTGSLNGAPFLVMQYLRRGSLREFCRSRAEESNGGTSSLRQSMSWLAEIADALDFLHGQELVHRDVKPANILLDDSLAAYLSDFGIAREDKKSTFGGGAPGTTAGSLPYMAPEAFEWAGAAPTSDQYSLAVTVFEFVMGRLPFDASAGTELLLRQKQAPAAWQGAPPEPCPPGLWAAIARAFSPDPTRRFESCRRFSEAVLLAWNDPAASSLRVGPPWAYRATVADSTRRSPPLTERQPRKPPPLPLAAPARARIRLRGILDDPNPDPSK